MPLTKLSGFTFDHVNQQDDLYLVKTAAEIKAAFDSRGVELKTALNALIDVLQSVTDGDSGADNVYATAIQDLTGTTVQALLESLRNILKSTTDGASGADFINSTSISGVNGTTVQSQLEGLKALIDLIYTKAQLQSTTDGSSGADQIGATAITGLTGNTVQTLLESLKAQINSAVLGQIPDGTLTEAKLSFDPATQTELEDLAGTGRTTETVKGVSDALTTHQADDVSHGVPLSVYRSGKDTNGIYTTIEYKRADTTLAKSSVLSGGTSPQYSTRTVTYYDVDGTTVLNTKVLTLSYTGDDLTSEVLS